MDARFINTAVAGIELRQAIAAVEAAGYRVVKPRKAKAERPALNAIGKPFGANYDPNYRMRYRTPALKGGGRVHNPVTPERWAVMVEAARKAWADRPAEGETAIVL